MLCAHNALGSGKDQVLLRNQSERLFYKPKQPAILMKNNSLNIKIY